MRTRAVLIIHEFHKATAHLAHDVTVLSATLRSCGLSLAFAHLATPGEGAVAEPGLARLDADASRDGDPWLRYVLARSQTLATVDPAELAAVVLCDQGKQLRALGDDADFARIVRDCAAHDRPLVAIGRAVGALARVSYGQGASFLTGRRVTYASDPTELTLDTRVLECVGGPGVPDADTVPAPAQFSDIAAWMRAAGAIVHLEPVGAEHVCVDAYLVTAQNVVSAATAARTVARYVEPVARTRSRAS